jgi:5-methylthioadenosine/S-adenosylhomocysteine deaminase
MRKILRNVRIIAADREGLSGETVNILIDGTRIAGIGANTAFPDDGEAFEEIDGTDHLALPGLINGHFHSPANLWKGRLPGLPLEVFMLNEVPPLGDAVLPDRLVYVRTMLGAIEMLKLGITAVQDDAFFVPRPTPGNIDAILSAYRDSGIRATVALDQPNVAEYEKYPFLEHLLPEEILREMKAAPVQSVPELEGLYAHLIDTWHGSHDGRLRAAVSCSAPHRVTEDYLESLAAMSHRHGIPYYMHILETRVQRVFGDQKLGRSLVQYVKDRGVLDHRCNIIHGIWLDDDDLRTIAESGAVIAHNPVCNLRLGSGVMPFRRVRDHGIPICIGTDEAMADDSVNLWNAVKMAGLIHNITDPDYEKWPSAGEILDCVFAGGARAMGLEGEIGALVPGHQADIVLLDLNGIAFTPLNDIRRHLVYAENGSDVRLTMVAGGVVMRDGRLLTVDEEAIKAEAREYAYAMARETGQATDVAGRLEPYYRAMYLKAAATDVGMERWAHSFEVKRELN